MATDDELREKQSDDRYRSWRKLFSLPDHELLRNRFNCAFEYARGLLAQGHLYVYDNCVCFYSRFPKEKRVLNFTDIANIEKRNSAGVVPNAIRITLHSQTQYFFTSFLKREKAFQLLQKQWRVGNGERQPEEETISSRGLDDPAHHTSHRLNPNSRNSSWLSKSAISLSSVHSDPYDSNQSGDNNPAGNILESSSSGSSSGNINGELDDDDDLEDIDMKDEDCGERELLFEDNLASIHLSERSKIMETFQLSANQQICAKYKCALETKLKGIQTHGKLYITESCLCFYGYLQVRLKLEFSEIVCISRMESHGLFPHTIEIRTNDQRKFIFSELMFRDETYNILMKRWSASSHEVDERFPCGRINVVLLEGKNFANQTCKPSLSCKFKVSDQAFKSKTAEPSNSPMWNQDFSLLLLSYDSVLDISIFDHSNPNDPNSGKRIGRCTLELLSFQEDIVQDIWMETEAGFIHFLLTLRSLTFSFSSDPPTALPSTSFSYSESSSPASPPLSPSSPTPPALSEPALKMESKCWFSTMSPLGSLCVTIQDAQGIESLDHNILKNKTALKLALGNSQRFTSTKIGPSLDLSKSFIFQIHDVHDCLRIECINSRNGSKFGEISIPLLEIEDISQIIHSSHNNQSERWFHFKKNHLRTFTVGKLLIKFHMKINWVEASVRSFSQYRSQSGLNSAGSSIPPRTSAFSPQLLIFHFDRIDQIVSPFFDQSDISFLFEWINPLQSLIALLVYVLVCLILELYHIPILLCLLPLYSIFQRRSPSFEQRANHWFDIFHSEQKLYLHSVPTQPPSLSPQEVSPTNPAPTTKIPQSDSGGALDKEEENEKEPARVARERTKRLRNFLIQLQTCVISTADFLEKVKNLELARIEYDSWLFIFGCLFMSIFLFVVPFRLVLVCFGLYKFTSPRVKAQFAILNYGILEFIKRVPTDFQLTQRLQLPNQDQNQIQQQLLSYILQRVRLYSSNPTPSPLSPSPSSPSASSSLLPSVAVESAKKDS